MHASISFTPTSPQARLDIVESVAIATTPSVVERLTPAVLSVIIERGNFRRAVARFLGLAADCVFIGYSEILYITCYEMRLTALIIALVFRAEPIGIAIATSVHKSLTFAGSGIVEETGNVCKTRSRFGTRVAHYSRVCGCVRNLHHINNSDAHTHADLLQDFSHSSRDLKLLAFPKQPPYTNCSHAADATL